jgi:hypothetical protein
MLAFFCIQIKTAVTPIMIVISATPIRTNLRLDDDAAKRAPNDLRSQACISPSSALTIDRRPRGVGRVGLGVEAAICMLKLRYFATPLSIRRFGHKPAVVEAPTRSFDIVTTGNHSWRSETVAHFSKRLRYL